MEILLVTGARPNFIKIAPIIRHLRAKSRDLSGNNLFWKLIHTGQHYDYGMSKSFFEELDIPAPDYFLNAGSGTHAEQTAKVMVEFENVCFKENPDMVLVVGDVNSTIACSIVAKKHGTKVAHVEAGLRSLDMGMPEEINRIVTDSISDLLFVSERSGFEHLKNEGKSQEQIFFVGNVMIDTLFYQLNKLAGKENYANNMLSKEEYGVITLHRPSNVDQKDICKEIIEALIEISNDLALIFPIHPRTRKNLESFGLMKNIYNSNIKLLPPLPYLEFLKLWQDAKVVFTDSGGLQEETTALGIPCFTVRDNTERPVTIEEGTNILVGTKRETILSAYTSFRNGSTKQGKIPELWDGRAAERIVNILMDAL